MINERPLGSNPYLQMRGESQLRAKHTFERAAGWRFGLVFGAALVVTTYVWDTAQLYLFHAEFWWLKFALASITILPLAILTGGIAGYVNWLLKLPLWAIFGIVASWLVIRIPFDASQFVLENFGVTLPLVEFLPMPEATSTSFATVAILGAGLGILVGLAQTVLVNTAWGYATEEYRVTWQGWALFFLTVPLAVLYAFLFDSTANRALRLPLGRVQQVIQSGIHDPADLDQANMSEQRMLVYAAGQRWKKQTSPDYTMRLASLAPNADAESFVDVSFDNGFQLRCRIGATGEITGGCSDLNSEYARYISEFVPRGSFRCADCEARVTQQAAEWRAANARPLTSSDKISIRHGAGSSITIRVQSQNDNSFECLIWGANPVIIEQCK